MQLPTDADLLADYASGRHSQRLSARWSSVTLAWFTPQHCWQVGDPHLPKKSARPCSSCLLARLPAKSPDRDSWLALPHGTPYGTRRSPSGAPAPATERRAAQMNTLKRLVAP